MYNGVFRTSEGRDKVRAYYNGILGAFPVKQKYVETSYGKTFLIEAGNEENETLLLLHGSCGNSAFWLGDIPALARKYHVYAADILGEAGNSDEKRHDLESGAYALWIKELLDGLGVQKTAIIGNSLGSWMALNFAVRFPERVTKLVLIAVSGIAPIRPSFVEKSIEFAETGKSGEMTGGVLPQEGIPQVVLDFMNLILINFIPITGQLPIYSDEELKSLKMPLLFIAGENDAIIDAQESAYRLSSLLPNTQTHLLKNCGHTVTNAGNIYLPFLEK